MADKVKVTLSINKNVIEKYKELANEKGLVISKQVENFMRKEVESNLPGKKR